MNTTVGGDTTFSAAGNAGVAGDDLTIDNAKVELNSASNATLTFNAGDDMVFKGTGNAITTGAGVHTIAIQTNTESSLADADGGTITQDTAATVVLSSNSMSLGSSQGIGTVGTRLHISADSITTTSNAGSTFLPK